MRERERGEGFWRRECEVLGKKGKRASLGL